MEIPLDLEALPGLALAAHCAWRLLRIQLHPTESGHRGSPGSHHLPEVTVLGNVLDKAAAPLRVADAGRLLCDAGQRLLGKTL